MKIYYAQPNDRIADAKIVRNSELFDKTYSFQECPAWRHKQNRTFVCPSPIDFEIDPSTWPPDGLDEYIEFDETDALGPKPIIQLRFPMFFFWTYDIDIWIEQYDHPITALNNNFISIGGWWNLSRWVRNTSNAILPVNMDCPIVIKKGDPLFRLTFHSKDMDEGIILHEESEDNIPQSILDRREEELDIIDNDPEVLSKKIFKCPYTRNIY
tara:strand:- start:231 stop:866 length:636 start_codon:yes stop_codon:yes gene_type:complete